MQTSHPPEYYVERQRKETQRNLVLQVASAPLWAPGFSVAHATGINIYAAVAGGILTSTIASLMLLAKGSRKQQVGYAALSYGLAGYIVWRSKRASEAKREAMAAGQWNRS